MLASILQKEKVPEGNWSWLFNWESMSWTLPACFLDYNWSRRGLKNYGFSKSFPTVDNDFKIRFEISYCTQFTVKSPRSQLAWRHITRNLSHVAWNIRHVARFFLLSLVKTSKWNIFRNCWSYRSKHLLGVHTYVTNPLLAKCHCKCDLIHSNYK